jgi:hypothetical protein
MGTLGESGSTNLLGNERTDVNIEEFSSRREDLGSTPPSFPLLLIGSG